MPKIPRSQAAIEFIGFNCFLLAVSKFIAGNINTSNATSIWVIMTHVSTFMVANICVLAFLSAAHNWNKFLLPQNNSRLLQKNNSRLLQRIIIYCLISFILPCTVVVSIFIISAANNPLLKLLWNALSKWSSELSQSFLSEKTNILSLFASGATLSIFPFIISWVVTGIFGIAFLRAQIYDFKEKRLLSSILFVLLKLSWVISIILAICIIIICLISGLGFAALAAPVIYFLWNLVTSHLYISGSWNILFSLLLLSWFIFSILTGLLMIVVSQIIVLISFYSSRNKFWKVIHTCVWKIYFPAIQVLQLKIVPLTMFATVSIAIHSIILRGLMSFQKRSSFIIDEVQIAEELIDFTILYVTASPKWLWLFSGNKLKFLASQLESLQVVARQMLLMGNIKQAEKLYARFPGIVDNLETSGVKQTDRFFLEKQIDILFKEIFEFYLRLNQKENAKSLYLKTNEYLEIGNLSFVNVLSIRMLYENYTNMWCEDSGTDRDHSQINVDKLPELVLYLIRYSPNPWRINKPQDLNKLFIWLLLNTDTDTDALFEIFKNDRPKFLKLTEEIENLFHVQSKIFAISKGKEKSYNLTIEEIETISEVLTFDILGMSLSFSNPFINENYTLIPLILAEGLLDFSKEEEKKVISNLINDAIKDNRTFDLAFLYCCQGKVLVKWSDVKPGFSLLRDGISLFEGIRNSVNSDELGIGFGDIYLKFYDWAIDAAIQAGDIRQAFSYSEHAKARATLDLLRQRTSSSTGDLQKNLVKLQNLDLSIAFVDSAKYPKPFYIDLLPNNLQKHLEWRFNNIKKSRIKDLNRNKKSIIRKIHHINPAASSLITFKPLFWSEKSTQSDDAATYDELWKKECITSNEAVISYHGLCDSQFTLGRQWNKIVCFYLFSKDNEIQLEYFMIDDSRSVNDLQENSQELIKELESTAYSNLSGISEGLVQPMLKHLPGHLDKLIIMGNDEFQFIPWSAMYLDRNDDRRLVDDFKIRVTPSLSLLFLLKDQEEKRARIAPPHFLIAGVSRYPKTQDFLYWAGFEIESIAKLYNNTKPIKDEAIDRQFIDEFQSSEIIHFSGHANYEESESINALERTYLCLYEKQLSAAQILGGELKSSTAKVMILSACLTGRGDLIGAGSEILGLERSLFYTGLSALVTTLWEVDDVPTSLLMIKFHSIWKEHNNSLNCLSSSLADAQIWLKNASLQDLKREIEGFENTLKECIEVYSGLIDNEQKKNPKGNVDELEKIREKYIELILKKDNGKTIPFARPYYWAGFQVKGVG